MFDVLELDISRIAYAIVFLALYTIKCIVPVITNEMNNVEEKNATHLDNANLAL